MNKEFYLDDYSAEDILKKLNFIESENMNDSLNDSVNDSVNDSEDSIESLDDKKETDTKPSFSMKPNYNSKGEKVVVFSIKIPLKNNGLKIDILINNDMYKNIGKHFKK